MQACMIPENVSNRISALRFLLMVLVIFRHNTIFAESMEYFGIPFDEPSWVTALKYLWSNGICQAAVPLFFLFSAYLQFAKPNAYVALLKKKGRTVFLPFILWSAIYIGIYAIVQNLPVIKQFFLNPENMVTLSPKWLLSAVFGFGRGDSPWYPLVYQFWFLRDLMVLILVSPVLGFLVKKIPGPFFLLLIFACEFSVTLYAFQNSSLFYYCLGIFFCMRKIDFFDVCDKLHWLVVLPLFLLFNVLAFFFKVDGTFHVMAFIACIAVLKFSRPLVMKECIFEKLKSLAGMSFFLYALHEPILFGAIKKGYVRFFSMSGISCLVEYVGMTLLGILICVFVSGVVRKFLPRVFALLSGGRL